LPKSFIADANTIQMLSVAIHIWAKNTIVGVSQLAAETMGFGRIKVVWQHNS
jgi:hypothetical protein